MTWLYTLCMMLSVVRTGTQPRFGLERDWANVQPAVAESQRFGQKLLTKIYVLEDFKV